MVGFSVEFLDHDIGWQLCFGDLLLWGSGLGCCRMHQALKHVLRLLGLLILRERIWAYGEGTCGGRVLGRSSLLDWGWTSSRCQHSTYGRFWCFAWQGHFENQRMWFSPQKSFGKIVDARVNSRVLIWGKYLLETVQRRGVITPLLWTLGAGTDCPERGVNHILERGNPRKWRYPSRKCDLPLSSGHSVPALTVQRRGVITPLLWTLLGTENIQICRFSKCSFLDF